MNRSWFIFYGLKLGMSRADTLNTRYGEYLDLLDCSAIYEGQAVQKKDKQIISLDEFLKLR